MLVTKLIAKNCLVNKLFVKKKSLLLRKQIKLRKKFFFLCKTNTLCVQKILCEQFFFGEKNLMNFFLLVFLLPYFFQFNFFPSSKFLMKFFLSFREKQNCVFLCAKSCLVKKDFQLQKLFGHYCHYCHYCHFYHIGRYVGWFQVVFRYHLLL